MRILNWFSSRVKSQREEKANRRARVALGLDQLDDRLLHMYDEPTYLRRGGKPVELSDTPETRARDAGFEGTPPRAALLGRAR